MALLSKLAVCQAADAIESQIAQAKAEVRRSTTSARTAWAVQIATQATQAALRNTCAAMRLTNAGSMTAIWFCVRLMGWMGKIYAMHIAGTFISNSAEFFGNSVAAEKLLLRSHRRLILTLDGIIGKTNLLSLSLLDNKKSEAPESAPLQESEVVGGNLLRTTPPPI